MSRCMNPVCSTPVSKQLLTTHELLNSNEKSTFRVIPQGKVIKFKPCFSVLLRGFDGSDRQAAHHRGPHVP